VADALNLAFLGCGGITRAHARTLRSLGGGVRLHFASRDAGRAADFARRLGGAGSFGSYEAALTDPNIDVVLIATPHVFHAEQTLAALDAGKHVIVEKPAFLTAADFERVRAAAHDAPGRVLVAENYFYKPLRRRLARIIAEGSIGEPLLLHLNAAKRQTPAGWRADAALAGGGGLFDGGIHWINLMSNLGLEVEDVVGFRAGEGTPSGEESLVAAFRYAGGAVGTLAFSWEVPSPLKGVRISYLYGREGTVRFESNGVFVFVQGRRTRLHLPGFRDIAGYRGMFTDFIDAIRTGREPEMTLDMAERDVRLAHRIYGADDAS
jgi:predicted dehydrogenase